jgi:hypothetical protein
MAGGLQVSTVGIWAEQGGMEECPCVRQPSTTEVVGISDVVVHLERIARLVVLVVVAAGTEPSLMLVQEEVAMCKRPPSGMSATEVISM